MDALTWFVVVLQVAGVISRKSDGGIEIWFLNIFVLTLLYHLCFWYMFRLSAADFKFALLMSIVSRICNFFLMIILLGLVFSLIAGHAQPTASQIIQTPNTRALAASIRPSKLAIRSGATENEVNPSTESPIRELKFQVELPWTRSRGS